METDPRTTGSSTARRAVIFDMDGVLVLTGEAHFHAWRAVGRMHGVEITRPAFDRSFGRTNPDCVRMLIHPDPTEGLIRSIAHEKERMYRDLVREDLPLAPGARELLESLREAGFLLAVGSSAPPENLDMILDGALLRGFFDAIVDGSMVARGKPAPDVFLSAAARLGVDPAVCMVIEDAPAGIQAARAAVMTAIGVATTHPPEALREAGAYTVVADLMGVGPVILGTSR